MNLTTLGIDLAKTSFSLVGMGHGSWVMGNGSARQSRLTQNAQSRKAAAVY